MFNNVALDVFIGLVFVYLIYSLLATVLQEGFASTIGLRGWILEKAIKRMLDDDNSNRARKYADELKRLIHGSNEKLEEAIDIVFTEIEKQDCYKTKNKDLSLYAAEIKKEICSDDPFVREKLKLEIDIIVGALEYQGNYESDKLSAVFYKHPLIKYLANGSWPLKKKPSYIDKASFSKVVIDLLRGRNMQPGDSSRQTIQQSLDTGQISWEPTVSIESETLLYLRSIWADSQGDVSKFQTLLEQWFDEMMERATGWYKKYTQIILLIIGLGVAIVFNVDSISIYKILSKDKSAREQLVQMAIKDKDNIKSSMDQFDKAKKDTSKDTKAQSAVYDKVYQSLSSDAQSANSVLGLGRPWDDSCKICNASLNALIKERKIISSLKEDSTKLCSQIDTNLQRLSQSKQSNAKNPLVFILFDAKLSQIKSALIIKTQDTAQRADVQARCTYIKREKGFFKNSSNQIGGLATFIGWLLTALAISLGAPFWFDMLNKLMQLRSSVTSKDDKNTKATNTTNTANAIKRVG